MLTENAAHKFLEALKKQIADFKDEAFARRLEPHVYSQLFDQVQGLKLAMDLFKTHLQGDDLDDQSGPGGNS